MKARKVAQKVKGLMCQLKDLGSNHQHDGKANMAARICKPHAETGNASLAKIVNSRFGEWHCLKKLVSRMTKQDS